VNFFACSKLILKYKIINSGMSTLKYKKSAHKIPYKQKQATLELPWIPYCLPRTLEGWKCTIATKNTSLSFHLPVRKSPRQNTT